MTTTFKVVTNNAKSKLTAAIDDAALEFTVTTGEGALFPSSGSFWVTINDEILSCSARSADTFTVSNRGEQDTDAAAHVISSDVYLRYTKEHHSDFITAINAVETASADENIQDVAGAMFTGNTETFITATYQDSDGTVDLVVPVKDEDNMASNSDTFLATQQSIKAYADTKVAHSLATAESDFIAASGVGAFVKKTLAETKTLLGLGGVVPTGTAEDDFIVAGADPFTWAKKTLAQVKTILGLGTAAYTAATAYVTHALATAANDFIVASGSGAYVKKTLAETQTILFGTALPENVGIILDPSLSADDTYSPVAVEVGVAGTALTHGEVIYQAVADGKWEKAKADAIATSIHRLGMCCIDSAENASVIVLLIGKIRADAVFPAFTAYAPVYISAATAGALTSTVPAKALGTVVRVVGQANSGDELWFNPDNSWAVYGA